MAELQRHRALSSEREVELAQLRMRVTDLDVTNRTLSSVLSTLHDDVRAVGKAVTTQSERTLSVHETVQRLAVSSSATASVPALDLSSLQRSLAETVETALAKHGQQQQAAIAELAATRIVETVGRLISPLHGSLGTLRARFFVLVLLRCRREYSGCNRQLATCDRRYFISNSASCVGW